MWAASQFAVRLYNMTLRVCKGFSVSRVGSPSVCIHRGWQVSRKGNGGCLSQARPWTWKRETIFHERGSAFISPLILNFDELANQKSWILSIRNTSDLTRLGYCENKHSLFSYMILNIRWRKICNFSRVDRKSPVRRKEHDKFRFLRYLMELIGKNYKIN